MPLSNSPTFEMEKLKRQASEFHQKLDGYTYEEVLLAVRSRQDSERYVRQVQRARIFVEQMTTSHGLSSKITNFYSKQNWHPMTWRRWLTMWRSCSVMDQRESFSRLRKPRAWNIPPTTLKAFHMRLSKSCRVVHWPRAELAYVMIWYNFGLSKLL